MSTTLQTNQSIGAKLLHVLTLGTRDVYKTQNGQLITMKADQGKVEVDDNGEVNIFDAKNVRAKGVNGQEDKFYLHNCTGSNNRGKRLNDAGDIFTQVNGEEATSASAGNDKTNADSDLGNIFNTIINGNEGEVNVENNYYEEGAAKETGETKETDKTGETEENKGESATASGDDEKISKEDMHKDIVKIAESTNHLGTDEDALAELLGKYAATGQIQELADEFKTLHAKDLYKQLSHETTGAAQKFIDKLFADPTESKAPYDLSDETQLAQAAQTLFNAMDRIGTDEQALIDILANPNYSQEDVQKIIAKYDDMFNQDGNEKNSFMSKLGKETSGFFEKLLMARLNTNSEE